MKKAFTLLEILCAVALVGVVTSLSVATYYAVSRGWEASTEYMDKMQRTDFALNQLISGLRSMYYPHEGKQDYNYGFMLEDNGDGDDPKTSDVIEWSKIGTAIVGNKTAAADTVHRVQVMVLEEGNRDWKDPIEITGLYARHRPDSALRPENDEVDYTFTNDEMYQPVLIADGIVGFNCRVMKDADQIDAEAGEAKFEDEWDSSNSVPYKVELTFQVKDPNEPGYRTNTAPIMRIIRIPVFEQSQDGSAPPGDEKAQAAIDSATRGGGRGQGGASGGGGQGPSGGGGAPPPGGGGGGAPR
ncbi:MAG: type II secretion system protein [Kiritimatiellae bacterium]|nr:type II secretion system protein [Kiritimatiellia bacterium]